MRQKFLMIAALVGVSFPVQSFATVYAFQATETSALASSPTTYDFSLDTSGATIDAGATVFSNVAITQSGAIFSNNIVASLFDTNLSSPFFFFVDTDPTMFLFSSGIGSGIEFNNGTFAIADGATDGEGTLTISSISSATPTPEPSTLSLMFTGVGVLGGVVWYRKYRQQLTLSPEVE